MEWSKRIILALFVLCSGSESEAAPENSSNPIIVGAMKEAMWNGRVEGLIDIDTISHKAIGFQSSAKNENTVAVP